MKTIYIVFTVLIVVSVVLLYTIYFHHKDLSINNNKNWFITYGGPDTNYHDAVSRLTKEIDDIQTFDNIIGYTDLDLKNDNDFWSEHSAFCEKNRGYGCWIWKPYFIMKTLELMDYNDVLLYSDAGCTINNENNDNNNNEKKDNMLRLIDQCKEKDLLFSSTFQTENKYSKMDLIKYLNMDNDEVLNSTQYQATFILIKKTKKTVQFVNDWYNTMCIYHLVNDNKSRYHKELPEFVESRHDQSVFSLLAKKYGYTEDNMIQEHEPINISRKRSG